MPPHKLSVQDVYNIAERRRNGERLVDLCAEFGISKETIYKEFKEQGISIRHRFGEAKMKEIAEAYASGKSSVEVAREFGTDHHTVLKYAEKFGCSVRDKEARRQLTGDPAFNSLYTSYRREAERRNLPFEITREAFEIMARTDCYYCGDPPSNRRIVNGEGLVYNGIDRVNSDKGYIDCNMVPCCFGCNSAKNNKTLEEYAKWLERLLSFNTLQKVRDLQKLVADPIRQAPKIVAQTIKTIAPVELVIINPIDKTPSSENVIIGESFRPDGQYKDWPPVEDLLEELRATSFLAVARRLRVSPNGIRHHLRTLNKCFSTYEEKAKNRKPTIVKVIEKPS